jgi:hypothetical protein
VGWISGFFDGGCLTLKALVPEGEDAECSNVEDPDKCTDAEKEELSEKVGEAIVYNTVLLEKGKQEHDAKAKESIGEKSKNEPKELKTNGVGAVKEEKKTNGVEAMKTNGVEKTNGVKKGNGGSIHPLDQLLSLLFPRFIVKFPCCVYS